MCQQCFKPFERTVAVAAPMLRGGQEVDRSVPRPPVVMLDMKGYPPFESVNAAKSMDGS